VVARHWQRNCPRHHDRFFLFDKKKIYKNNFIYVMFVIIHLYSSERHTDMSFYL
jgi:hypothetical protein